MKIIRAIQARLHPATPTHTIARETRILSATLVALMLLSPLAVLPSVTALPLQSYWELDGNPNASATAGDDWDAPTSASAFTGIIVEPEDTDTTYYGAGKDTLPLSSWTYGTSPAAPDKDEITNAYAALYVAGGEERVFFGLDRFAVNGDANVGFWFFKQQVALGPSGTFTGSHSDGDIFVSSVFTNGGAVSSVSVYQWQSGALTGPILTGAQCTATPVQNVCGIVNSAIINPTPWAYVPKTGPANRFPIGAFFEGGLNISALLPGTQCFSTFIANTRSSQSVGSDLKDLAIGSFNSCKLSIRVDPQSALNPVTTNHVLTITVNHTTGAGYVPSAGALVNATIVSGPGSFVGSPSCTTNATGKCTVTITSAVVGTTVVSASATNTVGGASLAASTDAVAPNSGPASKTWFKPLLATSTTTSPTPSSIELGASIQDDALVEDANGNPVTVGNVSFFVCAVGVFPCGSGGTSLGAPVALNSTGHALSGIFTPLVAGSYCFRGEYSGGSNALNIFSPSTDAGPNECFEVGKAASSTVTVPADSTITLGEHNNDSASVSGLGGLYPAPTGSVTFYICAQDVVPCSSGGTLLGTVPLVSGSATSPDFTPLAAGEYCFRGVYAGDSNYEASNDSSILECFVVDPAGSTTVTTPTRTTITLGESVGDQSNTTGLGGLFPIPTGTVQFYICDVAVTPCEQGGSAIGDPVALLGGNASSPLVTPMMTGEYCFRAEYSGDDNYEPSSDGRVSECFRVNKANSTTVTTPSSQSIVLGGNASDSAIVSGLGGDFPAPTGTVQFYVCDLDVVPCSSGGHPIGGPVALGAGGSASSGNVTPLAAGTYCFRAEYSGDDNYNASTDGLVNECFDVERAPSLLVTLPESASIILGASIRDSAHVSGLGQPFPPPTGNVTFFIEGDQLGAPVPIDEFGNATSSPYVPLAAGFYCFTASYSGDGNYTGDSEESENECFNVEKHSSQTITVPSNFSIVLGESLHDNATVLSGLNASFPTPTGNVSFYVCDLGVVPCSADGTFLGKVSLVDGKASSPSFTPLAAGSYCFRAVYHGDANYHASSDNESNECFQVTPAPSSTVTSPSSQAIVLGEHANDSATVNGLGGSYPVPTGNMTFWICSVDVVPCSDGGTQVGGAVALVGAMAKSLNVIPLEVGTYCFRGEYSGDANYLPSNDSSEGECFDVTPAASSTVTVPSESEITLGEHVNDTADVSGLGGSFPDPTGSVTFYICSVDIVPCEEPDGVQLGLPVSLDANGHAVSANFTPLLTGSYCFRGVYSGDKNYEGSNDSSILECFDVDPANSTTVTTPSEVQITLGEHVNDSAVLTGLGGSFPIPTGSVEFFVCDLGVIPCDSGGAPLGSATLVDGSARSTDYTPLAAGDYCFRAEYSGDANYNASSDGRVSECFEVLKAPSSTVTTPSSQSIVLGQSVNDSATVTGLGEPFPGPSGNITFWICAVNVVPCSSGGTQLGGAVDLDAAGEAHSSDVTPLQTGMYCFRAEYGGDDNYNASQDGLVSECFEVTRAPSNTTTSPSEASIYLGDSIHDDVVVTGLGEGFPVPTGTVTFYVCAEGVVPCSSGGVQIGDPVALVGGEGSSDAILPLAAGSYCFRGEYSGDGNYSGSSDASLGECFDVGKAASDSVTTPSSASITLGEHANDSAIVGGLGDPFPIPTGNVSFWVCAKDVVPCSAGGTFLGNATLVAGGARSADFTPLATGTYCFRAEYSGDDNYNASSDGRISECFDVEPAASQTVTSPSSSSIILGGSVHDTANVTGLGGSFPAPTGTVSFWICPLGQVPCSEPSGTALGSPVQLDANGDARSIDYTPLAAGSYCFRGEYSGDANYEASNDSSILECFDVDPANSTTVTTPSNQSIVLGESVHDRSNTTGAGGSFPIPSGNVTFFVCDAGVVPCASGGHQIGQPVPLVGGNASSDSITPLAAGDYCFRADYEGDANYNASSDASLGECFIVTRANSSTVTTPSSASIVLGEHVNDSAAVSGLGGSFPIPTGSVEFWICAVDVEPCSAGGTSLGSMALVDGSAVSANTIPLAAGRYCFRADYSGDANYSASSDGRLNECFDVTKHSTETTTSPSSGSILVGQSIHDDAVVSGGLGPTFPQPTGTVSFWVCAVDVVPCSSSGTSLGSVALVDGLASSANFTPLAAGTYCFRGEYSGDGNYSGSSDATLGECWTAIKRPSSIVTQASPSQILLGASASDGAVVSGHQGGPVPTGNVSFYICGVNVQPCSSGGALVGNATLVSGAASSPSVTPTASGTFCFRGEYSGDAYYNASIDSGAGECFVVRLPIQITRTQGFWQTHTLFTMKIFNDMMGGSTKLGSGSHGKPINDQGKLFGEFYSSIAKTTTNAKRTPLDQARMQLGQQLLAAKLNCAAFGCSASTLATISSADNAYVGSNVALILTYAGLLDVYNNAHDDQPIPSSLGTYGPATAKASQSSANKVYWNTTIV